jgi:serine/threonine-protein kinase
VAKDETEETLPVEGAPRERAARGLEFPSEPSESGSALGRELERTAVERLRWLSVLCMAILGVGALLSPLRRANLGARAGSERPMWTLVVGLAGAIALYVSTKRLSAKRAIDVGVAYLVLVCALTAFFAHALPYAPSDVVRGVSALVPTMLVFAVMVPVDPRRMAVGATLAALSDPVALALTALRGNTLPPWNVWLWLMTPTFVAAAIAVASSRVVFALGQRVRALRKLGSYRLVERLGRGGMGEVWRAEHALLKRPAAIKVVRPESLGANDPATLAQARERFVREVQTTARLTSPHVIDVFDFGEDDRGGLYYVMELLEGRDLESVVRAEQKLIPRRVARLLRQLLLALAEAHRAGLVHRDVKPANVFVTTCGGESDFVKLLDFGLVAAVEDAGDQRLTKAGSLLGTPGYMAPEAARGEPVDQRADLYAVGCIGYRLLCGREVFERQSLIALIAAHLCEAPSPIDRSTLDALGVGLAAVIERAIEKDRDRRWPSAEAMIEAIDGALAKC